MWKEIPFFQQSRQQSRHKLHMFNSFRLYQNNRSTCSIRQCALSYFILSFMPCPPATMSKQRSTLSKKHSNLLPKRQQRRRSLSWNFVLSTKSTKIEHVQFVSTFSKGWNFVRHCCQKRQQCRSNIRLCRKNRSTCSIRQCWFDIAANVDGALVMVS